MSTYTDPRWDTRRTRDERVDARQDMRWARQQARAQHRARRPIVTLEAEANRLGIEERRR